MTIVSIISWLASIGSIGGQLLTMNKKTIGWAVWSTSAVFWIITSVVTANWSQLPMWIFWLVTDIIAWIKWTRDDNSKK